MKKETESWLLVAGNDVKLIEMLIKETAESFIVGDIAFHCQQAVEKYFKAYLTNSGCEFRKTHDLIDLYKKIKQIKDLNLNEETMSTVNGYI